MLLLASTTYRFWRGRMTTSLRGDPNSNSVLMIERPSFRSSSWNSPVGAKTANGLVLHHLGRGVEGEAVGAPNNLLLFGKHWVYHLEFAIPACSVSSGGFAVPRSSPVARRGELDGAAIRRRPQFGRPSLRRTGPARRARIRRRRRACSGREIPSRCQSVSPVAASRATQTRGSLGTDHVFAQRQRRTEGVAS